MPWPFALHFFVLVEGEGRICPVGYVKIDFHFNLWRAKFECIIVNVRAPHGTDVHGEYTCTHINLD